jgi:hypothetical protein
MLDGTEQENSQIFNDDFYLPLYLPLYGVYPEATKMVRSSPVHTSPLRRWLNIAADIPLLQYTQVGQMDAQTMRAEG